MDYLGRVDGTKGLAESFQKIDENTATKKWGHGIYFNIKQNENLAKDTDDEHHLAK